MKGDDENAYLSMDASSADGVGTPIWLYGSAGCFWLFDQLVRFFFAQPARTWRRASFLALVSGSI